MSNELNIMFVSDKDDQTNTLKSISGIDEKGNLKTAPADEAIDQNQFFKVDKNLNPFENFFKNFWTQFKNPENYKFFRFKEDEIHLVNQPGEQQKHEVTKEVEKKIKSLNLNPDEKIDWKTLAKFGITPEKLKENGSLESMLKGYGSNNLIDVKIAINGVTFEGKARAFFNQQDDKITTDLKSKLDYPNFDKYDLTFTADDKKNMLTTGNLGRVVSHKFKGSSEAEPAFLSVDHLTNRIVALRASSLKIKDEYKGVKLTEEQKNSLKEGKAVYLTGMNSKEGVKFDGYVQANADSRGIALVRNRTRQEKTDKRISNEEDPLKGIPRSFGGQSITDEQRTILKDNGVIFVANVLCKDKSVRDAYFEGTTTGIKFYDAQDTRNASLAQEVLKSQTKYQEKYQSHEQTNKQQNTPKTPKMRQ